MKKNIAIITGGTGGHIFPALALAEELVHENEQVAFFIDQRGKRFIPHDMKNLIEVPIHRSFPPFGRFFYPFSLFGAFLNYIVRFLLKRPKILIGFGGYTTMPGLMAAYVLRIPIVIHEGNSFLGKANRFLQNFAKTICVSFKDTKTKYPGKTVVTGMPLRHHFFKNYTYVPPGENDPFHLLVLGGSQGSSLFSKLIADAINDLSIDQQRRLVVRQQCRSEQIDLALEEYRTLPCKVTLKPFFNDMEEQYNFAHLVIARAGSSSVFELIHTKRPAILYPFAAAIEGDQAKNASVLKAQNACWVLHEKETGPRCLSKLMGRLMDNPDELLQKSHNISKFQKENATKTFAEMIRKEIK